MRTHLEESVAALWPELNARLGARAGEFVELTVGNAAAHAITQDAPAARFVNLCCAFGPNFERRPENEWALAILADERLGEWVKLHQLVVRGAAELKRRASEGRLPESHATSDQLLRSDGLLLDTRDGNESAVNSEAVALDRLACDLEAADIRVMETDWRREYRNIEGTWQLAPVTDAAASIRTGHGRPAPAQVCVLTHAPASGPAARLQIRLLTHAICDQVRHPRVVFAGEHGVWSWKGHQARTVSWLVHAHPTPPADNDLGLVLIQETLPRSCLLQAATCGLRDEGVPTGSVQTHTAAYAADQYLFAWQRDAAQERQWPRPAASGPAAAGPITRCRIERDGVAMPSARWAQAFQDTLDPGLVRGFEALFAAWQQTTTDAGMALTAGLLGGRAALTWGWREGPQGMAGAPLMRVLGELDLRNTIDLSLSGEIAVGVTRSRVRLMVQGEAPMKQSITRDKAVPGLLDVLLPVAARWRFAWRIEFDPVAVEEGALWSEAGPCSGALTGEVGLRPRIAGGGGWQWYAKLDSEAVTAPVCIHDPVLGQTRRTLALLPALKLLDWSLG